MTSPQVAPDRIRPSSAPAGLDRPLLGSSTASAPTRSTTRLEPRPADLVGTGSRRASEVPLPVWTGRSNLQEHGRSTEGPAPRLAIVGTYPPTACGIATFTAALGNALTSVGAPVEILRVADRSDPSANSAGSLRPGSRRSRRDAVDLLNRFDLTIVQHEYGIYGGRDGEEILDVLAELRTPPIVVAHTVLQSPTRHQRRVLDEVTRLAGRVVVMTRAAQRQLIAGYRVDPAKVTVIPHGAQVRAPGPTAVAGHDGRPLLLTWGLIGPGKGIEWMLAALDDLRDLRPAPHYLIAGQTHPKVVAVAGEAYRDMLVGRASRLGVGPSVGFDATYRDVDELGRLIERATLVVLPYDSPDQVTSGVLVDAVAAGRPVVATAFPHATELLASGAGIVVPRQDPAALAAAVRACLTDPDRLGAMATEARRLAPGLSWEAVARRYLALVPGLVTTRAVR